MLLRRQTLITWHFLLLLLAAAGPAAAARYHVRVGGTRDAGPSGAGDWSLANCYPTLAGAALAAAPADSLLLFPGVHTCAERVVLRAFLGNRALAAAPDSARVACVGAGRLVLDAPAARAELRGVAFTGSATLSQPGLAVGSTGGQPCAVEVNGCDFSGFSATGTVDAGGSAVRGVANTGGVTLSFAGCTFSDNRTEGPGGAVSTAEGVDLVFTACSFTGNRTTGLGGRGGAVAVRSAAAPTAVTFIDCSLVGNRSSGPGGAVATDNASVHLVRCRVEGSRSGDGDVTDWQEGAGLLVHRSLGLEGTVVFTADSCTFADNVGSMLPNPSAGDGGAVLVKGSPGRLIGVTVDRCDFTANYNTQGAGLYVGRFATGSVSRSRFIGNRAWYQGGGAMKGGKLAECYGELVVFDYCEFVDNEAGFTPAGAATGEYSRGGGLMVRNRPRATLRNCTFVDNRVNDFSYAVGDGFAHAIEGGSWGAENQCVLLNTVFWGEGGGDVQVHSEDGGIAEAAHLALAPGQFLAAGAVPDAFVWLEADPFAGAGDRLPAAGSPLIDQGLDLGLTPDLPGVAVPQGPAPDIGAYERPGASSVPVDQPLPRSRVSAWPNPFNPRTNLAVTVERPGAYRLAVFDLRGGLVAELHDGRLPVGDHTWPWDGRDHAGRNVPAGIYLLRLSGPDTDEGAKLVLVR